MAILPVPSPLVQCFLHRLAGSYPSTRSYQRTINFTARHSTNTTSRPQHGNSSYRGTEKQCCNSATWKCGDTTEDCQAGTCYEGQCVGFPSEFSLNGKCGTQNGNKLCDKWGTCCNKGGVCGTGNDFCVVDKCQSGQCVMPAGPTANLPWQIGNTTDGVSPVAGIE
jgi:hypothetical protein